MNNLQLNAEGYAIEIKCMIKMLLMDFDQGSAWNARFKAGAPNAAKARRLLSNQFFEALLRNQSFSPPLFDAYFLSKLD